MILCLDVGNTHIYGGVYCDDDLKFTFRKVSSVMTSSDELGIFLRTVLKENGVNPDEISKAAFCSVVPSIVHSLKNCFRRYFDIVPFVLGPGIKTGLKIKYASPREVGADRIANAIAATTLYPKKDLVIVDFGTATTLDAVTKDKDYLGGAIVSGLKISMDALEKKTARLPTVEIIKPLTPCGRTTVESIQSGLFYGNLGMVREIVGRMSNNCFNGSKPIIIGTGGFAGLFKDEGIFDEIIPNLVLFGLYNSLKKNC